MMPHSTIMSPSGLLPQACRRKLCHRCSRAPPQSAILSHRNGGGAEHRHERMCPHKRWRAPPNVWTFVLRACVDAPRASVHGRAPCVHTGAERYCSEEATGWSGTAQGLSSHVKLLGTVVLQYVYPEQHRGAAVRATGALLFKPKARAYRLDMSAPLFSPCPHGRPSQLRN